MVRLRTLRFRVLGYCEALSTRVALMVTREGGGFPLHRFFVVPCRLSNPIKGLCFDSGLNRSRTYSVPHPRPARFSVLPIISL